MKDLKLDEHTGLVLEGGGMRGVFTCGVLDYLMDHDIRFPYEKKKHKPVYRQQRKTQSYRVSYTPTLQAKGLPSMTPAENHYVHYNDANHGPSRHQGC